MAYHCSPMFPVKRVHVIGAGGTGSRLIPLLAQFMSSYELEGKEIIVYDHDIVEEKNLLRQNFIAPDVGKSKAAVLASRYGAAYHLLITAHNTKFNARLAGVTRKDVVVICVDTIADRLSILSELESLNIPWPGILVLDSGNENTFGQISTFTLSNRPNRWGDFFGKDPDDRGLVDLEDVPIPWAHYHQLASAAETEVSCAEMDQTLAINALMGVNLMCHIQNWHNHISVRANQTFYNLSGNPSPQDRLVAGNLVLVGITGAFRHFKDVKVSGATQALKLSNAPEGYKVLEA